MSTGLIVLIVFIILIIGCVVWFFINNKKPDPTPVIEPQYRWIDLDPSVDYYCSGTTKMYKQKKQVSNDSGKTWEDVVPQEYQVGGMYETECADCGYVPPCICESKTHRIQDSIPSGVTSEPIQVGTYDNDNMCECTWSVIGVKTGEDFLKNFKFEDGKIFAIVSKTNDGEERTTRYITHLEGENVSKDDYFDVTQKSGIDKEFETYVDAFKEYAVITRSGATYNYLKVLYDEAKNQFNGIDSINGVPQLYKEENFPNIYNIYGNDGTESKGFISMVGWLFALQLSELKPRYRSYMLKIGYELGGYDRYSNIYGYKFKADPNVARLVASTLYSTMRSLKKPNVDAMRTEIGGSKYDQSLEVLSKSSRDAVSKGDFFIDFREFLPTAPGPYAPGYTTRPDETFPNEKKESNKNLSVDAAIHEMVVQTYNMNSVEYSASSVQAIADEESCKYHLFGADKVVGQYKFHPVFGKETIGTEISPDKYVGGLAELMLYVSSASRGIMQSATVDPKQYGRLRPGCSWQQEAKKNSTTDDRRNVLCEIDIEDNDGCKETANSVGYYNKDGIWVYTQAQEDKYCETKKNSLYANSYPSGHSSGMWGAAMMLVELFPEKADKIMKEANQFAINRTIVRRHWTSDTINGRVLGGATHAVCHATSDYDTMLNKAKKEL